MNPKEKMVILVLTFTFAVGVLVNIYKKTRLRVQATRLPIEVINSGNELNQDSLIDINKATREQLEALPGIGPVLAQRIIDYRQRKGGFKNIEELRNVPGIGPKRLTMIMGLVKVKK